MRMILVWCWGATAGLVTGVLAGDAIRTLLWFRRQRRP